MNEGGVLLWRTVPVLMPLLLFFPFSYAYLSRYQFDKKFHLAVDFLPAVLVSLFFTKGSAPMCLFWSALCYLAFISVYEVGYIVNDYVAVRWEANPRQRGPVQAGSGLIAGWLVARVAAFAGAVRLLGDIVTPTFVGSFIFLFVVFGLHNFLKRVELKFCTFFWLSVCRFVAPNYFLLEAKEQASLVLSAAILYSSFRSLSYLSSKDVLSIPGRTSKRFRLTFYLMPIPLAVALGWSPYSLLAFYFLALAVVDWFRVSKPS